MRGSQVRQVRVKPRAPEPRPSTVRIEVFAGTSHGDDEGVFFPSMSRRAILGTLPACARPLSPARPSLSRHATCHGGVSVTSLGYAGSAGRCPTPRGWARRSPVALTFTRLTLPSAYLRFGCWSSLCPVSLLTKEPNLKQKKPFLVGGGRGTVQPTLHPPVTNTQFEMIGYEDSVQNCKSN